MINLEEGRIEIPIYHNNEKIDFESILEEFKNNINRIKKEETDFVEALRD